MPLTDREVSLLTTASAPGGAAGTPIARLTRLTTSSNVYADVVTWTVSLLNTGDLHEISMVSDILSATQFRLEINAVQQWTDRVLQSSLSIPWRTNRLSAGTVVRLQARSPDNSTTVIVDGSISGTETPV